MQQIKLKRGLDIPLSGCAAATIGSVNRPEVFHVVPDHYWGIVPKLEVKEGAVVEAGSPIFHDKNFPEMLFTSPVSGKVVGIVRGERRKVLSIEIAADAVITYKQFDLQQDIRSLLLSSGLWCLIKQRPYDCIALPNKTPKAVFISSFDTAPLAPDYEFVLHGQGAYLQKAIDALATFAPVYVGIKKEALATEFRSLKNCTHYEVSGAHPAGNVSVQINHVAPIAKGETVWTINIQDLALIGKFLTTGKVDMTKLVAFTGPLAYNKQYYRVLPGIPLTSLLNGNVHNELSCRYVAGNALSGHQVLADECISIYENQYTVLDEGADTHEFMGWLLPHFNTFNTSCTDPGIVMESGFIRNLFKNIEYKWDARVRGGRRALIVSNEYDKVFPMDIYPEQLIRAMIAGNLDRMEQLGAYEVAPEDFALCEYVCTSKLPLQAIVRQALDNMKKEIE